MKKTLLAIFAGLALMGCGGEPELTAAQQFELKKLEMQQDHQRDLARIQANTERAIGHAPEVRYEGAGNEYSTVSSAPQPTDYGVGDSGTSSNGSESSILGTVAALGAGALAGYAVSELLDDGHRSYTDDKGRTRYVNGSGKEISAAQYNEYKKKHPTKHSISQYNQKGKAVVNTGKVKTVEAAKTVNKKVVQPTKQAVQKKTSSYKRSSSSAPRRR